jgi:cyclophilin family peptidyl-prolyl cis-trans isomerase/HEAT repeat protein
MPTSAAAAPPPPAPTAIEPRRATLAEVEPAIMAMEDRRALDETAIAAAASSPDPALRARAALAIGRIGDPKGAATLSRLFADPDPPTRKTAAFAAGLLREPSLVTELSRGLGDADPEFGAQAAWSLGFVEQKAAQSVLLAALPKAAGPERRAAIVRALWRYPNAESAAAAAPLATDPEPAVRAAALYALARRPQESSLDILTACLKDTDANAAALCARGLGILGKPESIVPLADAVEGRRVPVTINAMLALAAIVEKNPAAPRPPTLGSRALVLAGDSNPNVAVSALALLAWYTDDYDVFRRLWSIATTGLGRRRQVAIQALMRGLGAKAELLANTAAKDPDPFIRAAVADAASSIPGDGANVLRQILFADSSPIVRYRVVAGLKTPAEVEASRGILRDALADPDAGVRAAALDALGQLKKPEILPALREAVEKSYADAAPDVPLAAIGAAEEQAPSPDARAVVEAAYKHPSVLVSRIAARALVTKFQADPAAFPMRTYPGLHSTSDYAAILTEAHKPWNASISTSRGVFRVKLAGADAPMTVMNFVTLARKGYFDGAPIHRVVPNFVVQDGDPTGTGNGGPGYEIRDEINMLPYGVGAVGMALAGPDTGGSQWFTTQSPQPHLDGGYTVFGQVTQGMDVVYRIEQDDRIVKITMGTE